MIKILLNKGVFLLASSCCHPIVDSLGMLISTHPRAIRWLRFWSWFRLDSPFTILHWTKSLQDKWHRFARVSGTMHLVNILCEKKPSTWRKLTTLNRALTNSFHIHTSHSRSHCYNPVQLAPEREYITIIYRLHSRYQAKYYPQSWRLSGAVYSK